METQFVEHVQRRIRNLYKRKQRLDKYEELAQSGKDTLNEDQLNALASKETVTAPLKELNDVLEQFRLHEAAQKEELDQKLKEAAQQAKVEADQAARQSLRVLTRFLYTAALKHQLSAPENELLAVDTLLQKVYMGNDDALDAIDKLVTGSDEEVGGMTYESLRALSLVDTSISAPDQVQTESKVSQEISFLQEDELAELPDREALPDRERQEEKPERKPKYEKHHDEPKKRREKPREREERDDEWQKKEAKPKQRSQGRQNGFKRNH